MNDVLINLGVKYRHQKAEDILRKDPGYLKFIYRHAGCGGELKMWIRDHWGEIEEGIHNKELKRHISIVRG